MQMHMEKNWIPFCYVFHFGNNELTKFRNKNP